MGHGGKGKAGKGGGFDLEGLKLLVEAASYLRGSGKGNGQSEQERGRKGNDANNRRQSNGKGKAGTDYMPDEYYFIKHRHKNTKNLQVIKCRGSTCKGCTLLGPNPEKVCRWCQTPFVFPDKSPNPVQSRDPSRDSEKARKGQGKGKGSGKGEVKTQAQIELQKLLDLDISEDKAQTLVNQWFGEDALKEPPPQSFSTLLSKSSTSAKKLEKEIDTLQTKITQCKDKYEKHYKICDEVGEEIIKHQADLKDARKRHKECLKNVGSLAGDHTVAAAIASQELTEDSLDAIAMINTKVHAMSEADASEVKAGVTSIVTEAKARIAEESNKANEANKQLEVLKAKMEDLETRFAILSSMKDLTPSPTSPDEAPAKKMKGLDGDAVEAEVAAQPETTAASSKDDGSVESFTLKHQQHKLANVVKEVAEAPTKEAIKKRKKPLPACAAQNPFDDGEGDLVSEPDSEFDMREL
jgi:predicted  nucleic acid-binding Zn-ribbon protein